MDGGDQTTFKVTVREDGSVLIPEAAVAHFGLGPGDAAEVTPGAHGRLVIRKRGGVDTGRFQRWRGTMKNDDGLSTDEIMLLLRGDPDW